MLRYVLDANALMVRFELRAGADAVEALLISAEPGSRLMSVVNWGEVYYNVWRMKGQEQAERTFRAIDNLPIVLIEVNRETAKLAAELKAKFGWATLIPLLLP